MSLLIQYLVKLFISLSVVWLFYHFVLRKLTFYNSNRWYLVGYTLLSFFIPFINITPALEKSQITGNNIVQLIPSVDRYTGVSEESSVSIWSAHYDKWDWLTLALFAGAIIFLVRFIIRCLSFFSLRRKAKLISDNGIKVYQVNGDVIPFSFGNAVFINSELHTEDELQEIIRHEFVHVKQKHTLDILWSEWLCIINWYNPFAWLLKSSIRQNLEFIADNKVLENGVSKKQYQYLLLKVIGNNQFSIAPKFNFSSLKKRIAMMNKLKSARMHLVRFLFILPLLAVILISFRKEIGNQLTEKQKNQTGVKKDLADVPPPPVTASATGFTDSVPRVTTPNSKGNYIDIVGVGGECTVVVKDKNGKVLDRVLMIRWKENQAYFDDKYGEILPPPPPAPPVPPAPPTPPIPVKLPANVKSINVNNGKAVVQLKNGTKENYDFTIPAQKAAFEEKYGAMPEPPAPPSTPEASEAPEALTETVELAETVETPAPLAVEVDATSAKIRSVSNEFEITDKAATIKLKKGGIEKYDLTKPDQKAAFEKKYGRIISTNVNTSVDMAPVVAAITGINGHAVIAPVAVTASSDVSVSVIDDHGYMITGHEDILITITPKTTADELEEFKKQMKEKGITLTYTNVNHKDGRLVSIRGTMKSKDAESNFSVTDFDKVILGMIKDGDRTYFKVNVKDKNKEVI